MKFSICALASMLALANAIPHVLLESRQAAPAKGLKLGISPGDLNPNTTVEAHEFDATATRALTGTTIKTSAGKCLSVNPFSGDNRLNLLTVNVLDCDGSKNQTWDVVTKGTHIKVNDDPPVNVTNGALLVSGLTNGCINFDDRKVTGQKVLVFSCGGRAAGEGKTADTQVVDFINADGIQQFRTRRTPPGSRSDNGPDGPKNVLHPTGQCFAVQGNILGTADCDPADANQQFTYGGSSGAAASNGLISSGLITPEEVKGLISSGLIKPEEANGQQPSNDQSTKIPAPSEAATGKPSTGKQVVGEAPPEVDSSSCAV